MKLNSKKNSLTIIVSLIVGILVGSQIHSLIDRYRLWQGEKRAFDQLETSVDKSNSWVLISQYRWQRGDEEGSFDAAHKALEINPNNVIAIEKIAFNYLDLGDFKNAKIWLKKALSAAEIHAPTKIGIYEVSLTHIENQMKP